MQTLLFFNMFGAGFHLQRYFRDLANVYYVFQEIDLDLLLFAQVQDSKPFICNLTF